MSRTCFPDVISLRLRALLFELCATDDKVIQHSNLIHVIKTSYIGSYEQCTH